MKESEVEIGSIYETSNGNTYYKVSTTESVYLYNKDRQRSDRDTYIDCQTSVKVKIVRGKKNGKKT